MTMDIQKRIDEALESVLADIYTEKGIKTGEITPLQALKWDGITKEAAALFAALIEQNRVEKIQNNAILAHRLSYCLQRGKYPREYIILNDCIYWARIWADTDDDAIRTFNERIYDGTKETAVKNC